MFQTVLLQKCSDSSMSGKMQVRDLTQKIIHTPLSVRNLLSEHQNGTGLKATNPDVEGWSFAI